MNAGDYSSWWDAWVNVNLKCLHEDDANLLFHAMWAMFSTGVIQTLLLLLDQTHEMMITLIHSALWKTNSLLLSLRERVATRLRNPSGSIFLWWSAIKHDSFMSCMVFCLSASWAELIDKLTLNWTKQTKRNKSNIRKIIQSHSFGSQVTGFFLELTGNLSTNVFAGKKGKWVRDRASKGGRKY